MKRKSTTYEMSIIGIMSAVMCILGPLSIPIGVVPITLTNLAIYFSLYILGAKKGTISYIIYMLIGFAGLPVFSNFTGGAPKLFGPTGGYLIGFILMALISGFFIDTFSDKWYLCFIGMILGTAICYVLGTIWLSYQTHISLSAALAVGVLPFIPGDIIKILIATFIGPKIRKRLIKTNLLEF
ncbi:biotin transporter BioY [Clostridium sp. cel8]|jgi:biotin transport system substrate-specific component|uniref:biotin transporter BioY n=1 Tax=Clostridium sp. cel8 TaxID=2663123 RepID=UPI0015F50E7B|nr:biotin transporter BioY [Clostridium sp. cel8]MBA5850999.1 biotin transporter BioY [Clostridium sp. cel8]